MRSAQTFSRDFTLRLVKVMRMRCKRCSSDSTDLTALVAIMTTTVHELKSQQVVP